MKRRAGVCIVAVIAACAMPPGYTGEPNVPQAQSGGAMPRTNISLRSDDRTVIPSMTVVQAVDANDRYVFVATPNALGIYDRRFMQWLPPYTRADGWPATNISVMLADPADQQAVWFAADNAVYHYRVGSFDLVRALLPKPVDPANFFVDARDRASGVLIRTGYRFYTQRRVVRNAVVEGENTYMRVTPGGTVQQNIDGWSIDPVSSKDSSARFYPQTLRTVYARFRTLQDYARLITRDESMRSWPVTAGALSPSQSEAWMGSAGAGLFRVDPNFARSEHLPFGLLSDGAGAIALSADGVWIGGTGRPGSGRDGLTFTDHELRRWRWIDGGAASPFTGARVTAMSQYASSVWVATDRGVVIVDNQSGGVNRVWDGGGGVPLSIVARSGGAWVGTTRGISFVHDPQAGARGTAVDPLVYEGGAVRAIATRGDTVWIGSDAGVLGLAPGATQARRLRAAGSDTRLQQPVAALAASDSIVMVATVSGDVFRISAASGDVIDQNSIVNPSRVRRVYAMAIDARTLWLAGENGLLVLNRESGAQRFLSATLDLAGPAYGVVLSKDYAWVACLNGAVRLRRADDGTIR